MQGISRAPPGSRGRPATRHDRIGTHDTRHTTRHDTRRSFRKRKRARAGAVVYMLGRGREGRAGERERGEGGGRGGVDCRGGCWLTVRVRTMPLPRGGGGRSIPSLTSPAGSSRSPKTQRSHPGGRTEDAEGCGAGRSRGSVSSEDAPLATNVTPSEAVGVLVRGSMRRRTASWTSP